ncbi:MAG: R3H domain-containing nucleic acid-binding protein [Candidatus Amesbacteria bacterium]|nr:R3H domain-containing nucleic acid-binding protein [Candidatus Amesbacteria bacterium]
MDKTQAILKLTQEFLDKMGFGDKIEVTVTLDGDHYSVVLKAENPALLIGYHGNTLTGLQMFVSQHLHKQFDEWVNLTIDVNDYKLRREQNLKSLADSTVEQVLSSNQAYILPPMPASERRIIHMYLAEHPQVTTASSGEGRDRSVIISPKV